MKKPHPAVRAAAVASAVGLATLFVLYRGGAFAAPQSVNNPPPELPPESPTMISSSKVIQLTPPSLPATPGSPGAPGFQFTPFAGSKSAAVFLPPPPSSSK